MQDLTWDHRGGEGGLPGLPAPQDSTPRTHLPQAHRDGGGRGARPPPILPQPAPPQGTRPPVPRGTPGSPPPRTHCWEPAATPGRVTVTPRRPAWPRSGGDPGSRRSSVGREARRLPGPAENKVSSAPALTPGAICSGRAGLPGEPPAPPPPPRGSRRPGATRRRLRPGTPSCPAPPPHPPAAPSPPFPRERRQLPREAGSPLAPPHRQPLRRAAPATPNPNPVPGGSPGRRYTAGRAAHPGAP